MNTKPALDAPPLAHPLDPLLRRKQVLAVTGLSNSALYREMAEDRFPKPVRINEQVTGWRQSLVQSWIDERPEA